MTDPTHIPATPDTIRLTRAKSLDRALEIITDRDLSHILTTTESCGDQTWEHVETGAIIDLAVWIHDGTHPDAQALDSEPEHHRLHRPGAGIPRSPGGVGTGRGRRSGRCE